MSCEDLGQVLGRCRPCLRLLAQLDDLRAWRPTSTRPIWSRGRCGRLTRAANHTVINPTERLAPGEGRS
jgi:hypothetical protein